MVQVNQKISNKIQFLPQKPGVYLWKSISDEVIYVGKAVNLENRIKSYLTGFIKDTKTEQLLKHIDDIDYIITNTEEEAFILEANLIKRYQPKYNIMLKDDKRYPYVKISLGEPFPRLLVTREVVKDGGKYFGPHTDVAALRRVLRTMEWIFPLRTCNREISEGVIKYKKACINYQLGKCPAPCVGYITKTDYDKIVKNVLSFFKGKYQELIDDYRNEMNRLSKEMRYELAARYRDNILSLEKLQKRQTVYNADNRDIDIVGIYQEEQIVVVVILKMINGKILNQENYPLKNTENSSNRELLYAFIQLYYTQKDELPDEVLLPFEPANINELQTVLKHRLIIPIKGDRSKLLSMAKLNAFHLVEEQKLAHLRKANRTIFPIQELKDKLNLNKLPRKIVCMDISTIQGSDTVSSAVYFENGKPKKKYYRHFIIKSIDQQNDFAAMAETMERYIAEIDKSIDILPDLFIIDGGKGQLGVSNKILKDSKYYSIPIISLAKRIEEIYLPDILEPIILPRSSSALRLITTIRDEAHRFAINFHRNRRSKRTFLSELEDIPNVGEKTKFILLKHFGSIDNIKNASEIDLSEIKGIGKQTAKRIVNHFNKL